MNNNIVAPPSHQTLPPNFAFHQRLIRPAFSSETVTSSQFEYTGSLIRDFSLYSILGPDSTLITH